VSGVVAGLLASVKADSAPAPSNIVTNPSLTTNINGWEGSGNSTRDTVIYRSAPASLYTYFDGDNIPYASYSQASGLTAGQRYSLSFWIKFATTTTFRIEFAGSSTTTGLVTGGSSWQYLKFENVLAASASFNIAVYSASVFIGEFNIDDVAVVLGATALP